jgi:hypothetical protein
MEDNVLKIRNDGIQAMLALGVSKAQLRSLLTAAEVDYHRFLSPSPEIETDPLSAAEIQILKAGGARGLGQNPNADTKDAAVQFLRSLVQECVELAHHSLNLATVSELLQLPVSGVKSNALSTPPSLHAFELQGGQLLFPRWQFTDAAAIPHLASVLALTTGRIGPLALSRFMLLRNPDLEVEDGFLCPRDWLILTTDPELVLEQARFLIPD